ncbi:MAG: MerR family transcriptional regulator [Pseudomonadota bacterium]
MAKLFDDNRKYQPTDAEIIEVMGDKDRQAQLRHHGKAPAYYRVGRKIFYLGTDVNAWIESLRIEAPQIQAA